MGKAANGYLSGCLQLPFNKYTKEKPKNKSFEVAICPSPSLAWGVQNGVPDSEFNQLGLQVKSRNPPGNLRIVAEPSNLGGHQNPISSPQTWTSTTSLLLSGGRGTGPFCNLFVWGSLHSEHCLANGGFPVFWWKKPCFNWLQNVSFKQPCFFLFSGGLSPNRPGSVAGRRAPPWLRLAVVEDGVQNDGRACPGHLPEKKRASPKETGAFLYGDLELTPWWL